MSTVSTQPTTDGPVALAQDKLARRRRQCRINQRRYRDTKSSVEYNLRLDINELNGGVQQLKDARAMLHTRIRNNTLRLSDSVTKAVGQYFVVFSNGLHQPDAGDYVRQCYDIQVHFLEMFMDPEVQVGSGVGIDKAIEQLWRYSNYHSSMSMEVVDVEVFGSAESPIAKATGRLTLGLTRDTIELVFPHLVHEHHVLQLLVGREVTYPTCTEFVFDAKLQVVRFDFWVDFVSGLNTLLPTTELTSYVLEQALISNGGVLEAPTVGGPRTLPGCPHSSD